MALANGPLPSPTSHQRGYSVEEYTLAPLSGRMNLSLSLKFPLYGGGTFIELCQYVIVS